MDMTTDDPQVFVPDDSTAQSICTHSFLDGESAENDFQFPINYAVTPLLSNSLLNSAPTTPLLQLDQNLDIRDRGQSNTFSIDPQLLQDDSFLINPDVTIDPSVLTSGEYQSPFVIPSTLQLPDPFMSPRVQQKRGRIASITRPVVVTNNVAGPASAARQGAVDYHSLAAAHISDPNRGYSSGFRSMQQYLGNRLAIEHPPHQTPSQCKRCNGTGNVDPPVDLMGHQREPVHSPTLSTNLNQNIGSNDFLASNDRISTNLQSGQDFSPYAYPTNIHDQRTPNDFFSGSYPASYPNAFDTHSNSAGSNFNAQSWTNGQGYNDYDHIPPQRGFFYNQATYVGSHWDLLIIKGRSFTIEEGCLIVALQRDLGLDSDTVSEIIKFHREDFTPLPYVHFSIIMQPTQNIQISHVQQEIIQRANFWQQSAKQAYEGWLKGMGELIARMESSNFDNRNDTGNILPSSTYYEISNGPKADPTRRATGEQNNGSSWIWETRLSEELSAAEKGKGHENGNDTDQGQKLSRDQTHRQESGEEDAPGQLASGTTMQIDEPHQEGGNTVGNWAPSEGPGQKDIKGSWVPARLLSGVFSPQ